MTCNVDSGCRVCPGMWLAGVLMVIMLVQTWLLPQSETKATNAADGATSVSENESANEQVAK
ncbi:MAG: hypothetical protein U0905_06810 [Pirellulales bacterium]